MATSRRALWKGAISFGLVHIPVALFSATESKSLDFDWLDERSMEPVGYKRVNKVTGKEVQKEHIVKGIEYEDGQYVVLSAEEIAGAYPKTTQTVEIETFVDIDDIPFVYLDRPYYLAPVNKGAKVYALLREILAKNQKAGIAKVVIHTRQHLAVVMACGRALILNLMRWEDELRSTEDLNLPEKGVKANNLSAKEIEMAEQLVENMTGNWQPQNFTDSFREQILQLVKEKYEAGDTHAVAGAEALEDEAPSAKIYDLTEMLQRSLNKDGARPGKSTEEETPTPRKASKQPAAKTQSKADKPAKKQPARKSPARKASTNTSAAAPRKTAKTATKTPGKAAKQPAAKGPAKTAMKKPAVQKTAAQNTTAKKTAAKKTAAKPGSTQHKSRAKAA